MAYLVLELLQDDLHKVELLVVEAFDFHFLERNG